MKLYAAKSTHRILLSSLIAFGVFVSYLNLNQRNMIYFPDTQKPVLEPLFDKNVEVISINTEDGLNLNGWFKPAAQASEKALLMFHGNAGHIGYRRHIFDAFHRCGLNVLLAGYRGYGGNEGKPTEQGLYKDADAYLAFLKDDRDIKSSNIIVYGESLGTGVSIDLASRNEVAAVILEAPFDSLISIAKQQFPFIPFVSTLMTDQFNSIDKIQNINAPKLFMVAGQDHIVPKNLSRNLFDKANAPKAWEFFPYADHSGFYSFNAGGIACEFLKTHKIL